MGFFSAMLLWLVLGLLLGWEECSTTPVGKFSSGVMLPGMYVSDEGSSRVLGGI